MVAIPYTHADDNAGMEFFEARIRPVLVKHCYSCHALETGTAKGGLRLDTRASIRAGGERGPAVVPGDPNASFPAQWDPKLGIHVT